MCVCILLYITQGQGNKLGIHVYHTFEAGSLIGLGARLVASKPQTPFSLHLILQNAVVNRHGHIYLAL